jgi:hypothetical protein
VTFEVPASIEGKAIIIAAFIGENIGSSLQHINSESIPVK